MKAAGVPVEICPAEIDERGVEARDMIDAPGEVAALLAREKARAVAARKHGRTVLGADQTLALDTTRFSKPRDRAAAADQLRALRGKTHELNSAIAVMRESTVLFEHIAVARLTMRPFSEAFLDAYLEAVGSGVTTSVGAYQVEGTGVQLFERIEGDHSTILGLPLVPLLDWLRRERMLAA